MAVILDQRLSFAPHLEHITKGTTRGQWACRRTFGANHNLFIQVCRKTLGHDNYANSNHGNPCRPPIVALSGQNQSTMGSLYSVLQLSITYTEGGTLNSQ